MNKEQKKVPKLRFPGFTGEWEQRKLGEVFKYEQPGAYIVKSTVYNDAFETPVLTAGQSFILGYTNETDGIKDASTVAPVIIFDDFTTSSHYVDFPFKVKSSAMKLLTLANGSDDFYCAKHILQNIEYVPQSHERHWISKFAEFDVFMPIHEEQKTIGTFLKDIDTLITLQQRKLDQIKEYKKGMLQKMFPNEGETVPEVRFPGFTEEWEQHKFGEITEIKSASRVHRDEWTTAGVPFYRSSDVMSALNGTDNTKAYISEELYEKLTLVSGKLEQGDILVTGGGSVGNPYKVPNNEPLYTKDADLLWVKRSKWLHPDFVYQYFLSPVFRDYLSSISHVGTIAHYTITQLENTSISLPRIEEQLQIGQFLTNLDTLITLHQRKLEAMKEYKKGLLQQMFV